MLVNIRKYFAIKRSGLFDEKYYLLHNPDVRRADVDPLMHFVKTGWKERRNPSATFDTAFYLQTYADVTKRQMNPLYHYIRFGREEGRKANPTDVPSSERKKPRLLSKGRRTFRLAIRKAYDLLLPLYKKLPPSAKLKIKRIIRFQPQAAAPIQLSREDTYDDFGNPERKENMQRFFSFLEKQSEDVKNIQYIFFLPLFSTGGAELVALNFIRLILEKKPDVSVLLIVTDANKLEIPDSFPSRLVMFNLEEFLGSQDLINKKIFIYDVIQTLRPAVIHNINSSVFWLLLLEKGERLKEISKIFANIFCIQYDLNGNRTGYAEFYLKDGIKYLDGLLSDNQKFFSDAINLYHLEAFAQKMFVVNTPLSELNADPAPDANQMQNEICYAENHERLQCLWAGRLDEQKRWKLFLKIVQKCSFCDFDMYGQAVVGSSSEMPNLPNLFFKGIFRSFKEIFSEKKYDAFIFTTLYEGMPTTLLNIAYWGVPIIAPAVGGIVELVNSETGYLLSEDPTAKEYIEALGQIKENPNEARRRALNMRKLLFKSHDQSSFIKSASNIPGYI